MLLVQSGGLLLRSRVASVGVQWGLARSSMRLTRQLSQETTKATSEFSQYPFYLVSIPITTKRCYVYSKHSKKALAGGKESLEQKAIAKATQVWQKLEKSDNSVNKKVVSWVHTLLAKIPWSETSLRSIPSKSVIARHTKDGTEPLPPAEIQSMQLTSKDLRPVPLFYPDGVLTPAQMIATVKPELPGLYSRQKKFLTRDILLLPVTVPFILLPVIPNVPGFYLLYRAYCHWQVLRGVDHLQYLMADEGSHLAPKPVGTVESLYRAHVDAPTRSNLDLFLGEKGTAEPERLILSQSAVPEICKAFDVPELAEGLLTAISQEQKRLAPKPDTEKQE